MRGIFAAVLVGSTAACTTLGPMPATTGVSAIPAARPGAEAQVGMMPAYHLSSSVSQARGSGTPQLAALIEPDRWLGVRGLVFGGRVFGSGTDSPAEPLVGYRAALDDEFAVAVIGFATSQRAASRGATYHGFRAGAELAADGRIAAPTRWLAMHAQGSVAVTRVVASGRYCVGDTGLGKDCTDDDPADDMTASGQIRGVYPSSTATFALDLGRAGGGAVHGRFGVMLAAGLMPRAVDGIQVDARLYFSAGATLTLGFGVR